MSIRFNNLCKSVNHKYTKENIKLIKESNMEDVFKGQVGSTGGEVVGKGLQYVISGAAYYMFRPRLNTFIKKTTPIIQGILQRVEQVRKLPAWDTDSRVKFQTEIEEVKEKVQKWSQWLERCPNVRSVKAFKIKIKILLTDLQEAERRAIYKTRNYSSVPPTPPAPPPAPAP